MPSSVVVINGAQKWDITQKWDISDSQMEKFQLFMREHAHLVEDFGGSIRQEDDKDARPFQLRFHRAIPGWCKVVGLHIRTVPECEGGGFMVNEVQAKIIMDALNEKAES